MAGYPLGLTFRFLDPAPDATAAQLAEHVAGDYADPAALERFASGLEFVTYEFENVPVEAARALERLAPVYPPPQALEVAQDRLNEKTFFNRLGIPTAPFAHVDSLPDLEAAAERIGFPAVLKTRRLGYDGKGQVVLNALAELRSAWDTLGSAPLILEGLVRFEREVSILSVRSTAGETAFYPLVENHHSGGILRLSIAPSPGWTPELQATAESYATRVMAELNYVGVLAIELFQANGALLANEMAPRVHNSGHWSIEGAVTSQFENHLRAVLGLPLGSAHVPARAAMLNLIGFIPRREEVLAVPGAHLHLYGKEPRPGRKVGHVTIVDDGSGDFDERLVGLGVIAGAGAL